MLLLDPLLESPLWLSPLDWVAAINLSLLLSRHQKLIDAAFACYEVSSATFTYLRD